MKGKDLKNKETTELTQILSDTKAKMAKLSFELEANTLKNTGDIKKNKRDIARVLTEINSRKQ